MELRQQQILVAVAEEDGLQKAAARLSRTIRAVTMAIRKLEEEVGTPLF
jgi:DNA-binding transcriptional LysR family regulator